MVNMSVSLLPRLSPEVNSASEGSEVVEARALWSNFAPLEETYPGFGNWYWNKVLPGLSAGTRKILRDGPLSAPRALAIVKREQDEAKICTVWIAPSGRGQGNGLRLMSEAIDWLQVDKPLITIPAERYDQFLPLMTRLRFEETARITSLYRAGVIEHIFNGRFRPSLQA